MNPIKANKPEDKSLADYLNHLQMNTAKKYLKIQCSPQSAETAKGQVYEIYEKELPHLDAAAGELAPVFGLGDDLLAKQRAQGLFKHPAFTDAYVEFAEAYLEGRWDLPVGDWLALHKLVWKYKKNPDWSRPDICPDRSGWDVNHFYARFVLRVLDAIKKDDALKMAFWLKDASVCDAIFVLLFALMYMQLETMRDYKKQAPAKDRISHVVGTWKAKMSSGSKTD
ncbi:hypothetical protein F4821DRAFT_237715 [Hypoxylon rubiginosum]|uniref:Uncharacterized protein n=1 Tax=Hypoxylon rubiginosum TaxID=110542 RepID=A0ACC0D1N3_9PEZI|nr:hypothetical protein F4821DRAFT_237715 [Hypoxylon rubiginosum]